ncbi:MAG: PadR family transcriptional regulator [Sideroxyarcus sp.]|nr:PadR family transcriptional regulator [Sideroxyarcus sp.]
MTEINYAKYIPLSEASYYVLVVLTEPLHGYVIMQKVETISEGTVTIGPGTLYGAFSTLEKQGLIVKVKEEERRKSYALTELGKLVLAEQIRRLAIMLNNGQNALKLLKRGEAK